MNIPISNSPNNPINHAYLLTMHFLIRHSVYIWGYTTPISTEFTDLNR